VDEIYRDAGIAIYTGDADALSAALDSDPSLVTRRSSVGHPTLLQLVACDAEQLVNPLGSAGVLIERGAELDGPLVAAAGCGNLDVMIAILEASAPVDGPDEWTALDEAIYWCQGPEAAELLSRGASTGRLRRAAGLGDADAIAGWFDGEERLPSGSMAKTCAPTPGRSVRRLRTRFPMNALICRPTSSTTPL